MQRVDDLSGDARRVFSRSDSDLKTGANAIDIVHIEERCETHAVLLTEPQATRQAADRLRLSDVQVLILGGAGDNSVPGLGEIG